MSDWVAWWWIFKQVSLALLTVFLTHGVSFASAAAQTAGWHDVFNLATGILVSLVMFLVITLVATERVHRTLAVFFIAISLLFLNYTFGHFVPALQVLNLDQAFWAIDGEVIALLVGMMMIVGILTQTQLFEWIAVRLFAISRGRIKMLYVLFFIITAVASAFLDNVTTIFLMVPVAIGICKILDLNPVRFIIPLIIASNIWGTATLIGDPPNIMIGSYADLSFNAFISNLGIPVVIIGIIIMSTLWLIMRNEFNKVKKIKNFDKTLKDMQKKYPIKHKKLLIASLSTLAFVIIFFFLHSAFHMPAAVPALMWAALLALVRDRLIRRKFGRWNESREMMEEHIHKTFSKDVEWLVIGFFIFLFMVVGAVEHSGVLDLAALAIQDTFGDNLLFCALAILWISAIFSAFLDNIPFTAVMLPVVLNLVTFYELQWVDATFLWWSLAFGACLGWNGTLIGASANLVAAGLLEKNKFYLTFVEYFKIGFPLMLFQVFLASFAVYYMYLQVA